MVDFDNITKAFRNIVPLSTMGLAATFAMALGNKSLDQVVKDEVRAREEAEFDEFETDEGIGAGGSYEDYKDLYPDIVDQTIYQIDNPNALLTPWGPTLTDEEIDMVLAENPSIPELLSVDPGERVEVQAEAGNLLAQAGALIDDWWDQGSKIAMSVGGNALKVTMDLVDAGINSSINSYDQSLAGLTEQEGYTVAHPDDPELHVSTLAGSLYAGSGSHEDYGDLFTALGADTVVDANESTQVVPTLSTTPVPDPLEVPFAERQRAQTAFDMMQHSLLPSPEEEYAATDQDVIEGVFLGLTYGQLLNSDVQSFLDYHVEFESEKPVLHDGLMAAMEIIDLRTEYWGWLKKNNIPVPSMEDLAASEMITPELIEKWATNLGRKSVPAHPLSFVDPELYGQPITVDVDDAGPTQSAQATADQAALAAAMTEPKTAAEFTKIFYETMAGVPGGNHSEVRARMDELQAESEVLFWLWHADNAYAPWATGTQYAAAGASGDKHFDQVEAMYKAFLSRDAEGGGMKGYVWNPRAYKSGEQFTKRLEYLSNLMTDYEAGGDQFAAGASMPLLAMFGGDDGYSRFRMGTLAKLNATSGNTDYNASRIHGVMQKTMDWWRKTGVSEAEIFRRMTQPTEVATAFPGTGQLGAGYDDDGDLGGYPDAYGVDGEVSKYDFSDLLDIRNRPTYYEMATDRAPLGSTVREEQYDFTDLKKPDTYYQTQTSGSLSPDEVAIREGEVDAYLEAQSPWTKMGIPEDYFLQSSAALGKGEKFDTGSFKGTDTRTDIGTAYGYNEEEEKKRKAGKPYRTGRWTEEPKHVFDAKSAEDKKRIMADPTVWKMGPMHR